MKFTTSLFSQILQVVPVTVKEMSLAGTGRGETSRIFTPVSWPVPGDELPMDGKHVALRAPADRRSARRCRWCVSATFSPSAEACAVTPGARPAH